MKTIQGMLLLVCAAGALYLGVLVFSHPKPIEVSMPILTEETVKASQEQEQQRLQKQQAAAAAKKRAELEKKMYRCETNRQCIIVDTDACGCLKGPGSVTAINEDYSLEFAEMVEKKLTGMEMCPASGPNEKECSASAHPVCENNRCKIAY